MNIDEMAKNIAKDALADLFAKGIGFDKNKRIGSDIFHSIQIAATACLAEEERAQAQKQYEKDFDRYLKRFLGIAKAPEPTSKPISMNNPPDDMSQGGGVSAAGVSFGKGDEKERKKTEEELEQRVKKAIRKMIQDDIDRLIDIRESFF